MSSISRILFFLTVSITYLSSCSQTKEQAQAVVYPNHIFEYSDNLNPRWSSFENLNGIKGQGGMENNGGKGHSHDIIEAGHKITLLETNGPGIINRMWITLRNRSPHALRGLVINMYWDSEQKPAVSVPFGDFFGIGHGRTTTFENVFFANPEGRSFNSFLQMPFEKSARIEIINEMDYDIQLLFFDVDYQLLNHWDENFLYFHAYWHRDTATTVGVDFKILPKVKGKGRYLGTVVSVISNPVYKDYWWGEGEAKVYLDGDREFPTLVGTGTEDYIGTGWGQGKYFTKYTGSSIADPENNLWSFYRYHVIDPIYFALDCEVTIQQMGGTNKENVLEMLDNGVDLIPVTMIGEKSKLIHVYHKDSAVDLRDPSFPGNDTWTNFFRSDDVSAVAYFYLDQPSNSLPLIQNLQNRVYKIVDNKTL